jgi:hypothetical protein
MFTDYCNISESLQFLVVCREVLAGIVDQSSLDRSEKELTKSFIYNEASDYQVISMVVRGDLPEEKYNVKEEIQIFSELKEQLFLNYEKLREFVDLDSATDFLVEVNSVYPNFSSAKPILEHLGGVKGQIISEKPVINKALKTAADYWSGKGEGGQAVKKGLKTAKDYWMPGGKGGEMVQKGFGKGEKLLKKAAAGREKVQAAAQRGEAIRKAREAGGLKGLVANIKYKAPHAKGMVMSYLKTAAEKAKELGQDPKTAAIAGAALAALIGYGAYKLYKNKFSAAAKACKGTSGADKKACMQKAKNQAIQAQIQDMSAAASGCAKTKDPAKCKAAVQNKIAKLKKKMK